MAIDIPQVPGTIPQRTDADRIRDLQAWELANANLKHAQAVEIGLRKFVFGEFFPKPIEGTNTTPLSNGYVLKGQHKINRTIDSALLAADQEKLIKDFNINLGKLIEHKPSIVTRAYRSLTEKQRLRFDTCLEIKIGTPSLSIELPAKEARKG